MSAMVTSGVASFSTYRSSRESHAMGVSSPCSRTRSRQRRQMDGTDCREFRSRRCTARFIQQRHQHADQPRLGLPAQAQQNEIVPRSTAFTTWGTTVSSYPTMPGNNVSRRFSLQIRFSRSSSLTLR